MLKFYRLPTPATSLTANTWYDILTNKTVKDFVVAQGTSDIWTYRKWNSGIAECWGIYSYSYNSKSTIPVNKAFPFDMGSNAVVNISTGHQSNYNHWVGQIIRTSTTLQHVSLHCDGNVTVGGSLFIHVVGKWK